MRSGNRCYLVWGIAISYLGEPPEEFLLQFFKGPSLQGPGPDPTFLDTSYFIDMVLAPFNDAFRQHTGPFILEFQHSGLEADTFRRKFDQFLSHVPKDGRS